MLFTAPGLDHRERDVLAEIEDLRRRLRHQLHEPRRWYGSLRRLSIARAIQGSNSIEGFTANLDDAAAIAVGEEPTEAGQETRLALKGYRDAMTFVLQLTDDDGFAFDTHVLRALHFMITGYDLRNRPGRWRAGAAYVHDDETGQVVYTSPEIDQVPGLMAELVVQLNNECAEPIVHAAMAHLNLVMIHPFRDGNGRMARCLQSLVLARHGMLAPVFMSIEEYLGRNTPAYYDVLALVGGGSWHPENDVRPWIRFNLTAHLRQARTLLARVRETERLWIELEALIREHDLPERVMPALFDAAQGITVRNSTYRAALVDAGEEHITEQTASRDLQRLVAAGLLDTVGQRRGRRYAGNPRLIEVRHAVLAARDPRADPDPFEA